MKSTRERSLRYRKDSKKTGMSGDPFERLMPKPSFTEQSYGMSSMWSENFPRVSKGS
jgi:hypothetical protein